MGLDSCLARRQDHAAGDLVVLRVTAHGFELAAVQELTPCDIGAALAALLEERPNRPEMLDVAVWTVCAGDDGVFREPAAPLGDVLTACGLACEGDWVARGGFDFGAWRVHGRIETIKARYELHDDEALAVLATVRLYEQTPASMCHSGIRLRLEAAAEPAMRAISTRRHRPSPRNSRKPS